MSAVSSTFRSIRTRARQRARHSALEQFSIAGWRQNVDDVKTVGSHKSLTIASELLEGLIFRCHDFVVVGQMHLLPPQDEGLDIR